MYRSLDVQIDTNVFKSNVWVFYAFFPLVCKKACNESKIAQYLKVDKCKLNNRNIIRISK